MTSGTSKESFTVMLELKKFPDIPVSTQEEARVSRPHPEELRFRLVAREDGSFPCLVGKEFPAFPSHLKVALSKGKGRGTAGSCHHSKTPPDISVRSTGTCFPCTASAFTPRIDSHHRDTWDSPVGKPRGKDSRESHRSLGPRKGKRDTAATAWEERARSCPHSRRGPTPLWRLQKYPKIHVSTGEESSASGPDSTQGLRPQYRRERNHERPPSNTHDNWPFLRPPERVPESPS